MKRLTRMASGREMLAGHGIDVYMCGDVAVLRGAVRSAGDRLVLAGRRRLGTARASSTQSVGCAPTTVATVVQFVSIVTIMYADSVKKL